MRDAEVLASEGVLWETDSQGPLCMYKFMVEAHCLLVQFGRGLGFVGIGAAQAARIVNVGRCLAGVMHEVIRSVQP